ncbi:MAG TPA: MBL fold metallo-hydrolase [Nitrospiria bacterium]|jgi:metallo-beta-lactamase family protein|nr:MBL fold metallo-hydrolase [Nitrospiria bacterium]
MEITFLGATGTVTGSKYLIVSGSRKVLVDCGLFQGFKQLRLRNWESLPISPAEIDAVVLTHAHLDHSGYLPLLVKEGFSGRILGTPATRDLCAILLPDSGFLQEEDAEHANKHRYSKHSPALPLYTRQDALQSLRQFSILDYERDLDLGGGLTVRLLPAGHILGSAFVLLRNNITSILFSGDLGRPHDLIMKPPAAVRKTDYLVIESTYGNRLHDPTDPKAALAAVIHRTVERGGVLLIPSFAVGRTQSVLYYIHLLKSEGAIPDIPVYLNSPMAIEATDLYLRDAVGHQLTPSQCRAMCGAAHFVNSVEESKRLNGFPPPMIVISASGMATGGRVLHHIKAFAPDPRNTILFVGYQAGGTRGEAMTHGAPSVKIHGEYIPVRAEVVALEGLSAHADYAEIMDWLGHFDEPPAKTFITHGEPPAADALRHRIEEQRGWRCRVPDYLERAELK